MASDFGWTAWKEEVSLLQARAQSLQDLFEKNVKKLVYTWASTQRDLFGLKPGEEKERAVWIFANINQLSQQRGSIHYLTYCNRRLVLLMVFIQLANTAADIEISDELSQDSLF